MANAKVVYTVITDGYDGLKPPAAIEDDLDYVVFTDDPSLTGVEPWRPILIETRKRSPRVTARWYKLLPHLHLGEYESSLWIDATFAIVGPLSPLIDDLGSRGKLAFFPHPQRSCIYDEAEVVKAMGYERAEIVDLQMACYRARGYPPANGLCVSSVMFRAHRDPEIRLLMEDWWRQVELFSQRDQLSGNFVFWKHGIEYIRIPGHERSNDWLQFHEHRQIRTQFEVEEESDELDWLRHKAAQLWAACQQHEARGRGRLARLGAPARAIWRSIRGRRDPA